MTIEQTIEINDDRRIELELPFELPIGKARMALTIIPEVRFFSADGKSAFGCLNHYADPSKISGEKGAWERSVMDKYAKN